MAFDPGHAHRRSIRLRGYDYSQAGAYSVTVCTHEKTHVFGEIVEGDMALNPAGRMVGGWWKALPRRFTNIESDSLVVMPNHIHGIVRIVGADLSVRPSKAGAAARRMRAHTSVRPTHR